MINMQKDKKINVFTLLDEMNDVDVDFKNKYKEMFDYIFLEMKWSYLKIKKNKVTLYNKIESNFKIENGE